MCLQSLDFFIFFFTVDGLRGYWSAAILSWDWSLKLCRRRLLDAVRNTHLNHGNVFSACGFIWPRFLLWTSSNQSPFWKHTRIWISFTSCIFSQGLNLDYGAVNVASNRRGRYQAAQKHPSCLSNQPDWILKSNVWGWICRIHSFNQTTCHRFKPLEVLVLHSDFGWYLVDCECCNPRLQFRTRRIWAPLWTADCPSTWQSSNCYRAKVTQVFIATDRHCSYFMSYVTVIWNTYLAMMSRWPLLRCNGYFERNQFS